MRQVLNPVIAILTLFIALITAPSTFATDFTTYIDNPGGDQPDESFVLGDAIFPTKLEDISLNIDVKSRIAILDNGFGRESVLFLGLFSPVRIVKETEFSSQASLISLFIIPSGGLSYLKNPDGFRALLNRFVEDGGILFIFSQRFGKDYALLPLPAGEYLQGYGWLEDQSSLSHSTILTLRHPVVSGFTTAKPHLNIDGFFTSFPRKGKPLLRNGINGQPIMLIYRYGKGSVIASALYTDWAYLHTSATWDEVTLFSQIIKWAGLSLIPSAPKGPEGGRTASVLPDGLPLIGFSVQSDNEIYMVGSTATFTVNLWNNEDRKRTISVYYDGKGHEVQLLPHGSAQLTYSIPVYSARRLWVYFYDEKEIFLQTLRKGYTVVYPSSADKDEGKTE